MTGLSEDAPTRAASARSAAVALLNRVPGPIASLFRYDAPLGRLGRPLLNRLVPPGPTAIVVRSGPAQGLRLVIDSRNEKYYWTGAHELPVQRRLAELLRPGDTFWDVGAHAGFFAMLASRLVGENGSVHAFEPVPANLARLDESIRLNDARNVTVHPFALADAAGTRCVYFGGSSVLWSLVPTETDREGMPVPCRTLDDLGRELPPPDVVKVDVEGAELDVLRGGRALLAERRPAVVLEAPSEAVADEAHALFPFYDVERLNETHWLLAPR